MIVADDTYPKLKSKAKLPKEAITKLVREALKNAVFMTDGKEISKRKLKKLLRKVKINDENLPLIGPT